MFEIISCALNFIIIPIILGLLLMHFYEKEKNNILYSLVIGYIMEFAILQIIAIPMIFAQYSLNTLLYTFCSIIFILIIISIVCNIRKLKEIIIENWKGIKKIHWSVIIVILLVAIQVAVPFKYAHIDDDDAFYVATATTAVQTNTLYKYTALEGYDYYGVLPTRYVFSPFAIYIAIMSKLVDVHPAILAHSILPVFFISLAYIVYGLIAKKLFNNDNESINLFLIILSLIYIFGNYSRYSNFTFLLVRIWQGKAIIANIMLPFIGLLFVNCMESNKLINWILLFLSMYASCLLSEMGMFLATLFLLVFAFVFSIKDKKIGYFIKSCCCSLPCIIYAIIYLMI